METNLQTEQKPELALQLARAEDVIARAVQALKNLDDDEDSFVSKALEILREYNSTGSTRPGTSIVVLKTNCAPVINEVFSNVSDVTVIVLDEDTEGCGSDDVRVVEGAEHWVAVLKPELDVMRVADVAVELITGGIKL